MQDRIPKYPGRVKLNPVDGEENVFDMVRADEPEQEGTPLNKSTLLTDGTASMLGLNAAATVDTAIGAIAHRLSLLSGSVSEITITLTDQNGKPVTGVYVTNVASADGSVPVSDADGVIRGYIAEGENIELAVQNYFDLTDHSETISVTRGNTITKAWTLTRMSDELVVTSSRTGKFSGDVSDFDVCAVGGGGGGGSGAPVYSNYPYTTGGAGGGGGYVSNALAVSAAANTEYTLTVGSRGSGGSSFQSGYATSGNKGGNGGTSSMVLGADVIVSAAGGKGGAPAECYTDSGDKFSCAGGTGNGDGGTANSYASKPSTAGKAGSVYKYNDSSLERYGGGGGAGYGHGLSIVNTSGAGYGGDGGSYADESFDSVNNIISAAPGKDGSAYGGGGGGGASTRNPGNYTVYVGRGGHGVKGVIFLRWRYKTA